MSGIAVLGSTGSVGASTLDVVARHRDRYHVHTLAARSDHRRLLAQCIAQPPRSIDPLESLLHSHISVRTYSYRLR